MRSTSALTMGERSKQDLLAGLAAIYQSRDFSDLVVFGREGTRHAVHRAIVCPRSEFIYRACKEGRWRVRYTDLRCATTHSFADLKFRKA